MSDSIRECITKELGVEPIEIDSADFSAQHRKRLYWTNIPVSDQYEKCTDLFIDICYHTGHRVSSFSQYENTKRISSDGMMVSWDTSGKGNYSQQNRARLPHQKWNTLPSSGNDKNNVWLFDCFYRRIHPVEAERLQTLPDDYTKILNSKVKRVEVCGNGWTVNVIAHLLKGINNDNI